jgi:hypothetical protein
MIPRITGCIRVEEETYPGSGRMITRDSGYSICVDFGDDHGKVFDKDKAYVREASTEELEHALSKRQFAHYLVYAPCVVSILEVKQDEYWQEISQNAKTIVKDFLDGMKKVVGSPTVMLDLLKAHEYTRNGEPIEFCLQDVQDAYDVCYGDGCEYEWPYG